MPEYLRAFRIVSSVCLLILRQLQAMFAFTANNRWEPGIGDPTLMGWVTVAGYFVAALLCLRAGWEQPKTGDTGSGQRWFWYLFGAGFVLLGVNKQLDLQTWFTFIGKRVAQETGWYEQRRIIQAIFIAFVTLAGSGTLIAMIKLAGKATRPMLCAIVGAMFLGCFIIIRAASFHHVDQMLGMKLGGLKINWILELGSIACVAAGALLAVCTAKNHSLPPAKASSGRRLQTR